MPHSFRNHARLPLVKVQYLFLGLLNLASKIDVNGTFDEEQELVLFGMHLPLVPHTRSFDREDSDEAPVELHG